jgi:HD-like signal output (HDOD) protein/prolyl-tRNA editing enzyme YbaK/EbsC (Cys-tRNA(Pro) deacylase)
MDIAPSVRQYLDQAEVSYDILPHPYGESLAQAAENANIPVSSMAKAVLLHDIEGVVMAILPANRCINFQSINKQLHRSLQLLPEQDISKLMADCAAHATPPLPEAYALEAIVDDSLADIDIIYFEAGVHNKIIRMTPDDYYALLSDARHGFSFSHPIIGTHDTSQNMTTEFRNSTHLEFKRRLESLNELPAMPDTAHRLLELRLKEHANVNDLTRIIEQDPSLSAQLIRYARSSLYAYRGDIKCVKEAISRVLGYNMSMSIAIGVSTGKSFNTPTHGVLGLKNLWRHGVYCATLTQQLSKLIQTDRRPEQGCAYLSGLLHNFGYVLLGHLFQPEFNRLSKSISAEPETPIYVLDKRQLGIGHGELGAWLMRAWHMPEEVIVTQLEHHNINYEGPHAVYAKLVLLANQLLREYGIGDASTTRMPYSILEELGLDEKQITDIALHVMKTAPELDSLAQLMAA